MGVLFRIEESEADEIRELVASLTKPCDCGADNLPHEYGSACPILGPVKVEESIYSEALHPRGRGGEWVAKLAGLHRQLGGSAKHQRFLDAGEAPKDTLDHLKRMADRALADDHGKHTSYVHGVANEIKATLASQRRSDARAALTGERPESPRVAKLRAKTALHNKPLHQWSEDELRKGLDHAKSRHADALASGDKSLADAAAARVQQMENHLSLHHQRKPGGSDGGKFSPGDRVQHRDDGSQAVVTGSEVNGRTPVKFKDGSRDPEHVFHVKTEDLESLEDPSRKKKPGSKWEGRDVSAGSFPSVREMHMMSDEQLAQLHERSMRAQQGAPEEMTRAMAAEMNLRAKARQAQHALDLGMKPEHLSKDERDALRKVGSRKSGSKMSRRSGHGLLTESAVAAYEEALHPRGRKGQWVPKLGSMVKQKGYKDPFKVVGAWRGNVTLEHPEKGTTHNAPLSELTPHGGSALTVNISERPIHDAEFKPEDKVLLADGREGTITHKSRGGRQSFGAWNRSRDDMIEPEYAVATTNPDGGYKMEHGVKHSSLRYHPDEMAVRQEQIAGLHEKAEKGSKARPMPVRSRPVTLNSRIVPTDWQLEHGYAGKRATSEMAVLKPQHSSPEAVERMIYHYLTGHPPREPQGGAGAVAQFSYKSKGNKADREAVIRKLTQALSVRDGDPVLYERLLTEACEIVRVVGPVEEDELEEAGILEAVASFNERLHPRGRGGRFADVLAHLNANGAASLGHGVHIERKLIGLRVKTRDGERSFMDTEKAIQHAIQLHSEAERKPRAEMDLASHLRAKETLGLFSHGGERGSTIAGVNSSGGLTVIAQTRRIDLTDPGYDRAGDHAAGHDDALSGRPRAMGRGVGYRQGYDSGLTTRNERRGGRSQAQALVDAGLADDLKDARAQLADMGETGGRGAGGGERFSMEDRRRVHTALQRQEVAGINRKPVGLPGGEPRATGGQISAASGRANARFAKIEADVTGGKPLHQAMIDHKLATDPEHARAILKGSRSADFIPRSDMPYSATDRREHFMGKAAPGGERDHVARIEALRPGQSHSLARGPHGDISVTRVADGFVVSDGYGSDSKHPDAASAAASAAGRVEYFGGKQAKGGERGDNLPRGRSGFPVWEGDRLKGIQRILDRHEAHEIDGYLVDAQTANALKTLYDALSPANKAKFSTVPLARLVDLAWSAVT